MPCSFVVFEFVRMLYKIFSLVDDYHVLPEMSNACKDFSQRKSDYNHPYRKHAVYEFILKSIILIPFFGPI